MLTFELINLSNELAMIAPYFDDLECDEHHPNKCRYRRFAQYRIKNGQIERLPMRAFIQPKESNKLLGGKPRQHAPISEHAPILPLVFAGLRSIGRYEEDFLANVHFIRTVTNDNILGSIVPEGPHQDGARYLLLACVARSNIKGGETKITDGEDGSAVFKQVLQPGQGLVLNDRQYFHYVSDVAPASVGSGYRDALLIGYHRWADNHYGEVWERENLAGTPSDATSEQSVQ